MSEAYLSRHSSRLEGTLERSISPEVVEEAGEPVSSWISVHQGRESGEEKERERGREVKVRERGEGKAVRKVKV